MKNRKEGNNMTDKQAQMLLESIKIIAQQSKSKEEFLEALNQIQEKGKKNPQ